MSLSSFAYQLRRRCLTAHALLATATALLPVSSSCGISSPQDGGPGSPVWQAEGSAYSAPAWADSTVYFGTIDHKVVALDKRTGALRWRTPTGEGGGGSPGRNVLVVGAILIVPDSRVYGFDRSTGKLVWYFAPASGDVPGRYTISSDGSRVFLGSAAGIAYAIDAATGKSLWTNPLAFDGNSVLSYPIIDRGCVYLTLRHFTNPSTGGVVALDAATGKVVWERDFVATGPGRGAGSYGRVGIWHDLVISAAEDGTVYGLNRADGTIAWISPRPSQLQSYDDQRPVVVVGDVAVVGSDLPLLTGLDAATGRQLWRTAFKSSVDYEIGADAQSVFVISTNLDITTVDAASGSVLWTSSQNDGDFLPFPVTDGQLVYVGGYKKLYAVRR